MGIIYKLKPEIKEFILEQKRMNPLLSCRTLTGIVENRFQVKLSKSTINSIIKEAGLSLPVGRRRKEKKERMAIAVPSIAESASILITPAKTEESLTKVSEELVQPKPEEPVTGGAELPGKVRLEEPAIFPPEVSLEAKAKEPITPAPPLPSEPKPEEVVNPPSPREERVEVPLEFPHERECTGAILLKVADALIGGSYHMSNLIKQYLKEEEDPLPKLEGLIYHPLFDQPLKEKRDLNLLWSLVGKGLSFESLLSYLNKLQSVEAIPLGFLKIISQDLKEIHCIKIKYLDGTEAYLDAQMYTLWSVPHIPFDFSNTFYKTKEEISRWSEKDEPLVLFTAPGYDLPTKEFFEFILSLDPKEKKGISSLTLWDNRLEEVETIRGFFGKQRSLVFALWPWQFGQYRSVNIKGEFEIGHFENIKKDLYLAEVEVELLQPDVNKKIKLRGAVIRNKPEDNNRLFILTNLSPERINLQELSNLYLSYWPNLEESFKDFSRKIELFTYTPLARRFFFADTLNLSPESPPELKATFHYYLKALDFYVMWHFLPFGYEDQYFSLINERFYSLKANLKEEKECILITFHPSPDYSYLDDLIYACRRVNERKVFSPTGKRFWLSVV
ncbi:MAG: hypothetical protein NC912_03745 [Candidatus Omnitrophica bacterium]|nr:hypothetical protein [Candidatus Omnitrophota bacterium]